MIESHRKPGPDRGSALIIALALLSLFALMGTAYVKHVSLRAEESNLDLRKIHAASAAGAGIQAAIGEIATILERDGLVPLSTTFELPVYGMRKTDARPDVNQGLELVDLPLRRTRAEVRIKDESGRINVNHAPASVLRHLLGGDGVAARSLAEMARDKPFISLDDLMERGGLTEAEYARIAPHLTVYTVVDHENPVGYINLRAAAPEVIAALLDLNDEAAIQRVAQGNPKTLEQLSLFAGDPITGGKNPATFNIAMDPNSPTALPPALTLTSRCFRLISEGSFAYLEEEEDEAGYNGASARVEAVVLFGLDGSYEILKWTTQRNHLS